MTRISRSIAQKPKNGGWKKDGVLGNREFLRHFGIPGPGLFTVANGKLGVDIIDMGLDGAKFDELGSGDFLVGFAFGEQAEDEDFFGGQEGQEVFAGFGRDGDKGPEVGLGLRGQENGQGFGWPFIQKQAGSQKADGYQRQVIIQFKITVYDEEADDLEQDDDAAGEQSDSERPGMRMDEIFEVGLCWDSHGCGQVLEYGTN
jgi:hypothetical protein